MAALKEPQPGIRLNSDGTLLVGDERVQIPSYTLAAVVGQGANGVVLLGQHRYLDRRAAVKVWLTLRRGDRRDKFRQGMAEARKAAAASEASSVIKAVRVFEAGEAEEHFYAAMDYFPSISLKEWLREEPSLWARLEFASRLLKANKAALGFDVVHGDLHPGNILVVPAGDRTGLPPVDFRLVDFGTSMFASGRASSIARHWRVLDHTLTVMLCPFNVRGWLKDFEDRNPSGRRGRDTWHYDSVLNTVSGMVYSIARRVWPDCGADLTPDFYSSLSYDQSWGLVPLAFETELRELVDSGKLPLDEAMLGTHWQWRKDVPRVHLPD